MMKLDRVLLLSLIFAAPAAVGLAQTSAESQGGPSRYDVPEMNFDLWCQEEQHLPPARCDKRLPEDDAAFDAYRIKIERYEVPYLQEKQRQIDRNRDILHKDPVDHPDVPTKQGSQTSAPSTPPPQ
jgi:hypothetical protein